MPLKLALTYIPLLLFPSTQLTYIVVCRGPPARALIPSFQITPQLHQCNPAAPHSCCVLWSRRTVWCIICSAALSSVISITTSIHMTDLNSCFWIGFPLNLTPTPQWGMSLKIPQHTRVPPEFTYSWSAHIFSITLTHLITETILKTASVWSR